MRIGMFSWFGYPLPAEERFALIAGAGFRHTSLWWGDQFADAGAPKETQPDMARRAGLSVENIHCDFEGANLLWEDTPESEAVLSRYAGCVDDCAHYGIPVMVMHLSAGGTPPGPNELGVARLSRLIEAAERKNVRVALENVRSAEHLAYVFSRIDSDHLKFCYDSGHENCFTKQGGLLDLYGDRLAALHLHDNDGESDQHALPGEGTVNWGQVMRKLNHARYGGVISLEVTNIFFERQTPEAFVQKAFERALSLAGETPPGNHS